MSKKIYKFQITRTERYIAQFTATDDVAAQEIADEIAQNGLSDTDYSVTDFVEDGDASVLSVEEDIPDLE